MVERGSKDALPRLCQAAGKALLEGADVQTAQQVREFKITYRTEGLVTSAIKWAHDDKGAVRLLLSKNPRKNEPLVHLKRGGTGEILSVEDITGDERFST